MAGRKAPRVNPVPQVQTPSVDDVPTQHALEALGSAVQELQAKRSAAAVSVTGSRSSGDALENLLTKLASLGIIKDDTSA